MEQVPSLGRIVHYIVKENDPDTFKHNGVRVGDKLPAIITGVFKGEYGDGTYGVNLTIFPDLGEVVFKSSVKLSSEGENGSCVWPERV